MTKRWMVCKMFVSIKFGGLIWKMVRGKIGFTPRVRIKVSHKRLYLLQLFVRVSFGLCLLVFYSALFVFGLGLCSVGDLYCL